MDGTVDPAAAAAALFGVPEYSAEDALEVLVDAHLLESVGADRYRFHDLLRVYAAERAADTEAAPSATPRSPGCSAGTCGPLTPPPPPSRRTATTSRSSPGRRRTGDARGFGTAEEALAWYDSERANLVAATRQAAGAGLHDIAWRLPASLFSLFSSRGNWADCIATNRIALDSARTAGHRRR